MMANRFNSNSKIQLIWLGSRQQLTKLDQFMTSLFQNVRSTFSSSVSDLGITLDSALTLPGHTSLLTRFCYYQMRRLRSIKRSVSSAVFLPLYVHASITVTRY